MILSASVKRNTARFFSASETQPHNAPPAFAMAYVPPPRRAAQQLHARCTELAALLTVADGAAREPALQAAFCDVVAAAEDLARHLGVDLEAVFGLATQYGLADDGAAALDSIGAFQERVCSKWGGGSVELQGLPGHCDHVMSLALGMDSDPKFMTPRSLCEILAFVATLARSVDVTLGVGPEAEPEPEPEPERLGDALERVQLEQVLAATERSGGSLQ